VPLIEKDLNQGDHIYVRRKRLLYSHHGIYAGEGIVIHFKGVEKEKKDPVIRKTEIEKFLKGGKLKRRDYKKRLPHAETLRIAKEHLSKRGYSLAFNNCEHFATYCAIGKKRSKQIHTVVGGIIGVTFAVTAAVFRKRKTKIQYKKNG
jgi:hypothetical protein